MNDDARPRPAPVDAFTLLHDKNMLAPASASSWCPTMDLLALATTDGQLSLARLDWNKQGGERENKLWTTNPESPVTSLGWRPDGKVLASGHADGTVTLHHVEDGEVLRVSRPHAAAVTTLHWQEAPASDAARSSCAYQSAAARFVLPVAGDGFGPRARDAPRASASASASASAASASAASRALIDHFDPPARLTVLCTGDAAGTIALSAFGVFPVGGADLRSAVPAALGETVGENETVAVAHASVAPDLSGVLAVFEVSDADGSNARLFASRAATPVLADASKQLCEIASHGARARRLVADAEAEVRATADAWGAARRVLAEKMRALRERVRLSDPLPGTRPAHATAGGGSSSSPDRQLEEHFLALLASGSADESVEQFLLHEWRPGAARKAARATDAAATAAHASLLDRVGPTAEAAVLRLSELRALARWRERVAATGLDERALDEAAAAAERLSLAAAVAARAATETAARLRAFFVLVLRAQRTLAGEDPDAEEDPADALPAMNPGLVRAFLEAGVDADPLGAHLAPASEEEAAGSKSDPSERAAANAALSPPEPPGTPPAALPEGLRGPSERADASRSAFLAAVRGAARAAGFGDGADVSSTASPLPPLWRAAAELRGACETALAAPSAAVSASFAWAPAFAIVASGVDASGASIKPRVSHGGWSADGAEETLCFHAGAATPRGRHAVGLLALARGKPARALALEAPARYEVVDAAPYTKGRVLVLLQPTEAAAAAGGGGVGGDADPEPARVVMLDPAELGGADAFKRVDAGGMRGAAASKPPPGCVPPEGVVDVPDPSASAAAAAGGGGGAGPRWRSLPGLVAAAPLAVGRAKGLAAVLVGSRRAVLLDLEEDENEESDEEESDEEE